MSSQSGRRAAEIIRQLCERYGVEALRASIADARRIGERRAQAGLKSLPKGHFEITEPQDDGTEWKAGITITDTRFTVDLRDAPLQSSGPYNTGKDGAMVACQVLFKALTDPDRFANAGSFEPLEVLTTPGTVFHAGPEAAHAYYFETRMRLIDMLWHCLARAMPGRLPAGHFATIFGTVIAGQHPDTGRRYAMVEPQMGGWGATAERPGQNAMFSTNHGDTFNCPVEIAEARYGFTVLNKSLTFGPNVTDGYSGGAGVHLRYQLRNSATLSAGFSHNTVPVWSAGQAIDGGTNTLQVISKDGSRTTFSSGSGIELKAGAVVEIRTAHGGSSAKAVQIF